MRGSVFIGKPKPFAKFYSLLVKIARISSQIVNLFLFLLYFYMKVHLLVKQTIEDYSAKYAQSKLPFGIWLTAIKFADWNSPKDIQSTFGSADLLGGGSCRVVFDIGGNNYRMICKYLFGERQVHLFVCWIGTHAEYDKLCFNQEQYTVSNY